MTDRLFELARRIQQRPWNANGTDKTWVLNAMHENLRFRREVGEAKRVESR